MKTLTSAAALAATRRYASPLYLLRIDFTAPSAKTLRFSDRYVTALGEQWLPFVASWGSLDEALSTTSVDGRPATASVTFFNTKAIEGKSRLSDLIRTPLNTAGAYEWAFAKVTVYQLFEGLAVGDEVPVGVWYLEDPTEIGEDLLTVRMSDEALVLEHKLAVTRVSRDEFPAAPPEAIGRSIRRPFGVLRGVSVLPVVESATSRLASALLAAGTSIVLDDASLFPATGTVQIDSEHIVYTFKSGNTLTGLTRAANSTTATDHQDGAVVYEVRLDANAYRYAVGESFGNFKIKGVQRPRQRLDPSDLAGHRAGCDDPRRRQELRTPDVPVPGEVLPAGRRERPAKHQRHAVRAARLRWRKRRLAHHVSAGYAHDRAEQYRRHHVDRSNP